ncbi:hypothetical protein RFN29_14085 [Mesorhizobium sp. VK22B]|uniref:DUF1376 domain-containing protein n=1 Tax=Mesorhizobium captivum TaxID=3072319 RepID=A0ABU4Z0E2_9HYPH|nr:hypothetical protein [Mesorhizobium sp. VK22B]MDX8492704.1 hypothetical protein [Mesorhizobium sp. VK22B]
MTGRLFTKISPALWSSSRFHSMSHEAQWAFFYFCTSPHATSAGCYVLPDLYACADLHCDLATYQALRTEVLAAGMIDFDPDHSVVLIEKWFKHNAPTNESHALGTSRRLADIPSERLRKKAELALAKVEEARIAKLARDDATREAKRIKRELGIGSSLGSDRSNLINTQYLRGKSP